MGSSTADIADHGGSPKGDAERQRYHLKLMSKLAAKTLSPMKWSLVPTAWRLPKTHPFYVDERERDEDGDGAEQHELKESADIGHRHGHSQQYGGGLVLEDESRRRPSARNQYSMWPSGWSANIIGTGYLRESGQSLADAVHHGIGHKLFGDVELDLVQCKEQLLALADSYADI